MKKREKRSSIQIRYLKYTVCLLLSAMLLCGAGVSWVVQKNQETVMMDNYNTMCENLGAAMDLLFEKRMRRQRTVSFMTVCRKVCVKQL